MLDRKEGPYRLVLGADAAEQIKWHCGH